jgi:hypothetical protein
LTGVARAGGRPRSFLVLDIATSIAGAEK